MFKKLLIISGPTATGKTALAVKLARKFKGELVSADSRQIYKGMDIGTGKDHPKNIKLHLIDIINPTESFSVAQYQRLALEKIKEIWSKNKLPIIVGGTGLYIDSIISQKQTFHIRPNYFLRFFLNRFPLKLLQIIYKSLDLKSFLELNNSDINNPRRLIRKIEIALFSKKPVPPFLQRGIKGDSVLHLSLTASNPYLYQQIDNRVDKRLKNGLIDEIKYLLTKYKWSDPGLNTLAYKEFKPYLNCRGFACQSPLRWRSVLDHCLDRWCFDEHKYARRQKTWFKKIKNVTFFDITNPNYPQSLIDLVHKWYN